MNEPSIDQPDTCEHWVEPLSDGTAVLIRPLREEDQERDRRFMSSIAREARHLRVLAERDASLARHQAYIALTHVDGELRQIGVSRYVAEPGSRRCECAVAVSESWQRKGLGRLLLQHLIAAARREGYQRMVSNDQAHHYAVHRLAKALGFTSRYQEGDVTTIIHELELNP